MPDGGQLSTRVMPLLYADAGGPMSVLSVRPVRLTWHRATVLGVVAGHVLAMAMAPSGIQRSVSQMNTATIDLVEVEPRVEPTLTEAVASPLEPVATQPDAPPLPEPAPSQSIPEALATPIEPAGSSEPLPPTPALPSGDVVPDTPPTEQAAVPNALAQPEVEAPPPDAVTVPRPLGRVVLAHSSFPRAAPIGSAAQLHVTKAVRAAPPPAVASTDDRAEQRVEQTLDGRIRDAVQAAVRCPVSARMMGQSGKAGVAFDYRDGAVVSEVQLTRSSGTPVLDSAALTAVRTARYPVAPSEVGNHVLHLLVWVDEACG